MRAGQRKPDRDAGQTPPLPGSRPTPPPQMGHYIITLKPETRAPEAMSRQELYTRGVARATAFVKQLRVWLTTQGLESEVEDVGEPLAFDIVPITSTPAAAKKIEALPDVEFVVRDSEDLGLVR